MGRTHTHNARAGAPHVARPQIRVRTAMMLAVRRPKFGVVDSAGDTIDFLLSPKRDLIAAKLLLRLALSGTGGIRPRVINVDGHPAYARAIAELKRTGDLGRRCRCRPSPYLNSIIGYRTTASLRSASQRAWVFGRRREPGGRSRVTRQCM